MEKTLIRFIPTYRELAIPTLPSRLIQFIPLDLIYDRDVPGFTHRVLIDGCPIDWLSNEYKPSNDTARYFLDKHPRSVLPTQESLGQKQKVDICKECNKYPAEKEGICQPCLDYRSHTQT